MNPIVTIFAGLFFLLVGGGLTLYSYVNRDPVTGEYVIWYSMIIVGAVGVAAGLVQRNMEDQPL